MVGIAGLVIALIALVAAALSPWIIEALDPKPTTLDEAAVEMSVRIKDRLAAKAKGQEYVAPAKPQRVNLAKYYAAGVIGAGALAACIGVVGLVCRHDHRLNSATIAVGAAAVVFQYALILAGLFLLILLVALIVWVTGAGS